MGEKKIADQNKTTEYTNVIIEANVMTNEKVAKEKTAWECGTDRLADVANTDVEKTAIEIDSFETPSAGQVSTEIGKTERTEKEDSENLHTIIEKEKIEKAKKADTDSMEANKAAFEEVKESHSEITKIEEEAKKEKGK